jgi:hypothetical protein
MISQSKKPIIRWAFLFLQGGLKLNYLLITFVAISSFDTDSSTSTAFASLLDV